MTTRTHCSSSPFASEEEGEGGEGGLMGVGDFGRQGGGGGGITVPCRAHRPFVRPHLWQSAVGAAGDGRHDGMPPGGHPIFPGLSWVGGSLAAAGAGATVPRCRRPSGAAPSPPPLRLEGPTLTAVIGPRAAACGDAGYGNPLGNVNAAAAAPAVAGKVDNVGQENNDCSGNDGDVDKDNNKWGRGA